MAEPMFPQADEKPRFEHRRICCVFLGVFEEYDLYFCQEQGWPTVLARFGDEDHEYASGFESNLPALREARIRAQINALISAVVQ